MAVRPRDPNDPDFPHGSTLGYRSGCRSTFPCPATPTCIAVRLAADAERRREGRTGKPRYRPGNVIAYVQEYLDRHWTVRAFAAAAHMNHNVLARIMHGESELMLEDTARRLLAVDDDALYAAVTTGFVPASLIRWKLGSLCAIGWPCAVQADLLGYNRSAVRRIVRGAIVVVRKDFAEDVSALFDRFRKVPSTSQRRRQAIRMAKELGFHTPDAYAPDGTLWEDDVRDEKIEERWARRDRSALLHMQVAALAVRDNLPIGEIQNTLQMHRKHDEEAIRRARAALGLKWKRSHDNGPEPGQEKRIATILAVVERWRRAGRLADPFPFCQELGMMTDPMWSNLDGKPRLEAA